MQRSVAAVKECLEGCQDLSNRAKKTELQNISSDGVLVRAVLNILFKISHVNT